MRLWSIHPKYLDSIGLVALWREGLLAKKVLQGKTKGYKHHPQLTRFKDQSSPVSSINGYLHAVWEEAGRRGYSFDRRKIGRLQKVRRILVSSGQLDYELKHLRRKLRTRSPRQYRTMASVRKPDPHPLFKVRTGPVAEWEKA